MNNNFLSCNISTKDIDWFTRIAIKPGYYLLRLEEDKSSYGPINAPVHIIRYDLLLAVAGTDGSLIGYCGNVFASDYVNMGTVTGFIDLGLQNEITTNKIDKIWKGI